jgi:hypothetical protein
MAVQQPHPVTTKKKPKNQKNRNQKPPVPRKVVEPVEQNLCEENMPLILSYKKKETKQPY